MICKVSSNPNHAVWFCVCVMRGVVACCCSLQSPWSRGLPELFLESNPGFVCARIFPKESVDGAGGGTNPNGSARRASRWKGLS